jgi:hypothetical protein
VEYILKPSSNLTDTVNNLTGRRENLGILMTITVTSPITGAAQTGFTSPTYTLTGDTPPNPNGKQNAVTALGGTQAGASVHSVASPFTISAFRPAIFKALGKANPTTGVISTVPRNVYKVITRKGLLPLAGQAPVTMLVTTTFEVPAGADLASPGEVRAAISAHIGAMNQQSAGIGDTLVSGII